MQDRFKFRAWFNPLYPTDEKPKMVYDVENTYDFMRGADADCFGEVLGDKNYTVMQSTGLKDKNGKLIYESDVVYYNDDVYGICKAIIKWDVGRYQIEYYSGGDYGWFSKNLALKDLKNIEIIGNIYTNPELLGAKE